MHIHLYIEQKTKLCCPFSEPLIPSIYWASFFFHYNFIFFIGGGESGFISSSQIIFIGFHSDPSPPLPPLDSEKLSNNSLKGRLIIPHSNLNWLQKLSISKFFLYPVAYFCDEIERV